MLNAQQVEAMQNAEPTDWTKHDRALVGRSDWDQNRFADDAKLHVRFLMKPIIDQEASDREQRPIYRDCEFCEIMIPGDKHNIVVEPVDHVNQKRFAAQYAQFKQGITEQVVGTPLKVAGFLTDSQIEELKYFNIRTVEQLAGMNDGATQKMMGGMTMKQAAQKFLDKANSVATLREQMEEKFAAERKGLESKIEELRAMLLKQAAERNPKGSAKAQADAA